MLAIFFALGFLLYVFDPNASCATGLTLLLTIAFGWRWYHCYKRDADIAHGLHPDYPGLVNSSMPREIAPTTPGSGQMIVPPPLD